MLAFAELRIDSRTPLPAVSALPAPHVGMLPDTGDCGGVTPDVVLTEVEAASNALGELTGRTAREDMVARIFERFCVGK